MQQFNDRWDKLQTLRCNPLNEIEMLCSDISGSVQLSEVERTAGFDPGAETITHRFGGTDEKVRYSFDLARMLEDGALPITLGLSKNVMDMLADAAKTIAPFARFWSLSLLLRTRREKDINEWFDRARLASLAQDDVDKLLQFFLPALMQAIDQDGNGGRKRWGQQDIPGTLLNHIPELLSRLCIRLGSAQLEQLFEIGCKLYNSPVCREQIGLYAPVHSLFKRLLGAMPQDLLVAKLPALLSLPMPGEANFSVVSTENWVEPFWHVDLEKSTRLDDITDRSALDMAVGKLVWLIKTRADDIRARASVRLAHIYEIGVLSDDQARDYGEALWSQVDPSTGLPSHTGMLYHAFLDLPEPEVGMAKAALRTLMLKAEFPQAVRQEIGENGKPKTLYHSGSSVREHIQSLGGASLGLFHDDPIAQQLIDWTPEEAAVLLSKLTTWWNNDKLGLQDRFAFFGDNRGSAEDVLRLLSTIILPRLSSADKTTKKNASDLIDDMQQMGLNVPKLCQHYWRWGSLSLIAWPKSCI